MSAAESKTRYFEGIGRRKTAHARVRVWDGAKASFMVNEKTLEDYFPTSELQTIINQPFVELKMAKNPAVTVVVKGGGIHSQAEAVRMGIARALMGMDGELRKPLKAGGFIARDDRAKERRKFGLKKARKSPQWSKR